MPINHAAAGGSSVGGKDFKGGQFVPEVGGDHGAMIAGVHWPKGSRVPATIADTLDDNERAAVQSGGAHGRIKPATEAERKASGQYLAGDWSADAYFDLDDAGRASYFLDALEAGDAHPDDLDPDTRTAVAEDLAGFSDKPRDFVDSVLDALLDACPVKGGVPDLDSPAGDMLRTAVFNARFKRAKPFKPTKQGDGYTVVNLTKTPEPHRALLRKLLPVFESADGSRMVFDQGHVGNIATIETAINAEVAGLDDEESMRELFPHLADPRVHERDVPASAKNAGRVSGDVSGAPAEWDSDAVDVYRPLNKNWILLRRGTHNPELADGEPSYEIVPRAKMPPTSNLPPQFWANLKATEVGEYDADRTAAIADRADPRGKQATELRTAKQKLAKAKVLFGRLQVAHNEAAGVAARAEAQQSAMDAANDTFGFVGGGDEAHEAAGLRLETLLAEAASTTAPDAPDIDYTPVNEHLAANDEGDQTHTGHIAQVKAAAKDAAKEYAKPLAEIAKARAEAEAFVAEKRSQWAELAQAARGLRDASRVPSGDLTEDDAYNNFTTASDVYVTATRQGRRLDRAAARTAGGKK